MTQIPAISILLVSLLATYPLAGRNATNDLPKPALDPFTGLVMAQGWELVRTHCFACHSMKTITQSGKDRANWAKTLQTMQQKEGLYPLGDVETEILDYLEENYPVSVRPHNPKIRMPIY